MDPGLILLGFLALLVAFSWSRLRRRLGMGTTGGRTSARPSTRDASNRNS